MVRTLLKPKLKVQNSEEVIRTMGKLLFESTYVAETYVDAVLKRENSLPTGLELGRINVAIPHTDSTHVYESCIALATLDLPVKFHVMVEPEREIDVSMVFLLAVKDPNLQLELLKNLMLIFQSEDLLLRIKNINDSDSLSRLLTSEILR